MILALPRFQDGGLALFEHKHRIGLVVFPEKELVRGERYDRTQAEQKLEDVCPDTTENGHALQEFDPRGLVHGTLRGCRD
jgi:hypothetical protein